ncbi:MAG: hypothetical protein IT307_15605 [Chloroflexi bacterium]|nr:hypothetical protein [Chloroflexota bacterium]
MANGVDAREHLRRLIDAIPNDRLAAAAAVLEPLADPVLAAFVNAPDDDEPVTPGEKRALLDAREDLLEGRVVSDDELRCEIGW